MARITVEDCLQQERNRFALVLLASKRTKQILGGSGSVSTEKKSNKPVVTALREIAEGKVRFMNEAETSLAAEEERKRSEDMGAPTPRESREAAAAPQGPTPAIALSLQSLMGINRPRTGPAESDDDD